MKSAEKSSQETASTASQSFAFYSPSALGRNIAFPAHNAAMCDPADWNFLRPGSESWLS